MKRLLFALAVTAALATGTVVAKDTWIPFGDRTAVREGSFEIQQREEGELATVLVRSKHRKENSYDFVRMGVRLTDCARGYGTLLEFDLTTDKQTLKHSYVSEGGTVGAALADAICAAAAKEQETQAEVDAFAADPRHVRFEEVRGIMGDLIDAATARGEALSWEEAYAQACQISDRAKGTRRVSKTQGGSR